MYHRPLPRPIWLLLPLAALWVACSDDSPEDSEAASGGSARAGRSSDLVGFAPPDGPAIDPVAEFERTCGSETELSLDCEFLLAIVRADVLDALERLESARDKRAVDEALAALELADEPEIQIAAMRILSDFPGSEGLAAKALPLLDSPYLAVQEAAAELLSGNDDSNVAGVGLLWSDHHREIHAEDEYEEIALPKHYGAIGFPSLPGVERFTPGDSDRSVGWSSAETVAEVAAQITAALGVEPIGFQAWMERSQRAQMQLYAPPDPELMAEMERVTAEYVKAQDPKLLERLTALQKKMSAPMELATAKAEKSVDRVAMPPDANAFEETRYWVAEEKDGRVAKLVVAYPVPALGRTAVQMTWNLTDHPSSWSGVRTRAQ